MLQQTTVATVRPRFRRFLDRWPTIEALAAAADEEILAEWAGLGYYARARNLAACAREVASRGGFPRTEAELRRLPGLGAYTAAAIAAIAFGERAGAVDTNILRVIARHEGLKGTAEVCREQVREIMLDAIPEHRPGDFVQALMDLGAAICTPRAPRCELCPIADDCTARASGEPEAYPTKKAKAARPHRHGVAWWIERKGSVWLVRRPAKGMLGGMAALPGDDWQLGAPPSGALATVRHGFTHFTLDLHVMSCDEPPPGDGWWQPLPLIGEAGLPTLYARAVEAALSRRTVLAE